MPNNDSSPLVTDIAGGIGGGCADDGVLQSVSVGVTANGWLELEALSMMIILSSCF